MVIAKVRARRAERPNATLLCRRVVADMVRAIFEEQEVSDEFRDFLYDRSEGNPLFAEELLRGQEPSEELFAQAAEIASADCSPGADGRGPIDYKRHLAGVLTHRALRRAATRALQGEV